MAVATIVSIFMFSHDVSFTASGAEDYKLTQDITLHRIFLP
jgi:hypothetical protein